MPHDVMTKNKFPCSRHQHPCEPDRDALRVIFQRVTPVDKPYNGRDEYYQCECGYLMGGQFADVGFIDELTNRAVYESGNEEKEPGEEVYNEMFI